MLSIAIGVAIGPYTCLELVIFLNEDSCHQERFVELNGDFCEFDVSELGATPDNFAECLVKSSSAANTGTEVR